MLYNFRWFIQDTLAGSSKPCYQEDVEFIVGQGIQAIISLELTHDAMYQWLREAGIEIFLFPIEEDDNGMIEPREDAILTAIDFYKKCLDSKKSLLIHCSAGIRRTSFLARELMQRFHAE